MVPVRALAVLAVAGHRRCGDARAPAGSRGRRATVPAAPVPALAGVTARCLGAANPVDVGAVAAGTPTLLNLWASWCAPCREEMSVLGAYAQTLHAVRVIGVNVTDRPDAAVALMRDLGIRYPSLTDADDVQRALSTPPLLQLSYLVTGDGTVRRLQDVLVFRDSEQVRGSVTAVLAGTGNR